MIFNEYDAIGGILAEVFDERARQDAKWGEQNHPNGTGDYLWSFLADDTKARNDAAAKAETLTWETILLEEVYEAVAESDPTKLRVELLQVAAVASAWVQAIDRRGSK